MVADDIHCSGDRRRGGDVERLGAAGPQRDRRPRSHRRRAPRGQPVALGAQAQGGRPAQRLQAGAAVGDQRRPRRRRLPQLGPGRRPGEERTHAGPRRLRREGIGAAGAERDRDVEQRVNAAHDGPDVPRVPHAVQVDAGRARRLGPAQRPDRDRPRPRAQRRGRRQQLRLDLLAAQARNRRRSAGSAAPRPRPRPASTRSSPSVTNSPRARGACARAACEPVSASRFGGFRSSVVSLGVTFWSAVSSPGTKKAGRVHGPPGKVECLGCG